MKKITSLFVVIVIVMLMLCSCGEANNNTITAWTIYKEYDIDYSFDDFDAVVKTLEDLYEDSTYLVGGSQDLKKGFIWVTSRYKDDGEKTNKFFWVEIYDSKDEAHDFFEFGSFSYSRRLRTSMIRVNNTLISGDTYLLMPYIEKLSLSIPSERKVPNSSVETIDKEIDVEKLFEKFSKSNLEKFCIDETKIYSIINKAGTSIMIMSYENKPLVKDLYDLDERVDYIAGKYVEYNNCAFIFLDDFWLDMIKQCEK